MKVLPMELWMQVFQDMRPKDCLKLMTTCRLFNSLLEVKLYKDIRIRRSLTEEDDPFAKESQSMKFVQTLMARPSLFSLVRKLRLFSHNAEALLEGEEEMPKDNYWNHPVIWQLPCFPHLRYLVLIGIHIDVDCYTAIRSIPRLECLELDRCDIDAALLDLQPFQGNTISTLSIGYPKDGDGWAALMTPGLHTFIVKSTYENVHMDQVLRGLLSCDLRRTLTKLEWTLDDEFHKELCQFIEPCVQLESLSITYRSYPQDDVAKRSSHFEELSSGSLPMLSKFGGSAEYLATIMAGRSVHSVSLQLWDDTPKDVLLALQLSKVPVTRLELSRGDHDYAPDGLPPDTRPFLEHLPDMIEILFLDERSDKEKLQSWIPALSNLSHLQAIECAVDLETFTTLEVVQLLSEACPSIRNIFLTTYRPWGHGKWVWRNGGSWEHYPVTVTY